MTAQFENKDVDTQIKTPLYEAARGTAVVGGIFSVIVLGLLVINYLQIKLLDPLRTERLENWKIKLLEQPNNEQLLSQIRELDLQIRKDRIGRLDFSQKGSLLLLGAIVVFLLGIKSAKTLKKRLPYPIAPTDIQTLQIRQAVRARWVMTTALALLAAAVLLFAGRGRVDFIETGPSYATDEEIAKNWPGFRGPQGSGRSAYTNVPVKWDGNSGEAIVWKTNIPLPGHNSPVVWNDRIFISGANKKKRQIYCYEAISGKLLWQADVINQFSSASSEIELEEDTGYAAPTVATDGKRVFAIFPTGDVGCFDFEGKKLWSRDLGVPDSMYGYASSLAVYQNLLFIQYDQATAEDNKSRMIALDTFSGTTVWETKRPVPNSWTSPIVVKIGNQSQLITCGDPWVIAYDPLNGAELWRADCLGTDVAPSPIYAGGFVFGIHPYTKMVAIKPTGRGDVTKTHIVWKAEDNIPDICSPVSNGELVFILETQGILTCYKVSDGTKLWEEDLQTNFTSSPSLVGDSLYLLSEKGVIFIIKIATEYMELAQCRLGENCYASPAFADSRIYIRADKNLYCIGNKN
jgi:outer membrane protein assembly factor BamB